ncbi:MAG: dual specificity protein phosphatase family protein [Prevotellaceae bacterium]|jgi:protein tyrosine/serine phosphatase|nr:dual specificity protein phosphatase family protein [Prevotellaceae bacterium]
MKRTVLFLIGITCSVLLFSQSAVKTGDCGLNNFYRVDEGVYRSEQPDREQFKALEKYGIKEVLNLRYWHSDRKYIKDLNITGHRVKMNAHDANSYDVVRALRIIKNRKGPILIHCHHGSDRTGLIVAMYMIVFRNRTKKEAIDEMINGGFGFHKIYDNIPRYINSVDIDSIKKQLEVK